MNRLNVLLLFSALFAASASASPKYRAELANPPSPFAAGSAQFVFNDGTAVGNYRTASGAPYHAFRSGADGVTSEIAAPDGWTTFTIGGGLSASNYFGIVSRTGESRTAVFNAGSWSFVPGNPYDSTGGFSARSMAADGTLVGTYNRTIPGGGGAARSQSAIYRNGGIELLPDLGGDWSDAWSMNASGTVVGISGRPSGLGHAFAVTNGAITDLGDLATINYSESYATDINDLGCIVGAAGWPDTQDSWTLQAFVYEAGKFSYMGELGISSWASALNKSGTAVGWYDDFPVDSSAPREHAFIYEGDTMLNLQSLLVQNSGWTLTAADDINDSGVIVGRGVFEGKQASFRLVPVPEQSPILGIAFGGLALLRRKRRL